MENNIEDFEFHINSGSTEELFKEFETIIPLSVLAEPKVSISNCKKQITDDVFNILLTLDRTMLIENVTKYLDCGFMSYDPDGLVLKFGTDKSLEKEQVTPLLLVILAIGILYRPDLSKPDFTQSLRIYVASCKMTSLFYDNISVDNVELLGLNSWYLRAVDQKQSSIIVSAMSIQIAVMLRLHQNNSSGNNSERQRKVWWAAYSINRFFSVRSGYSTFLNKNLIRTPYPEFPTLNSKDRVMINIMYDLALIAEEINDFYLHKETTGMFIIDKIMGLIQSLIKWKESSPIFTELNDLPRSLSSLNLNYSHLIQLTTIPVLLHLTMQKLSGKQIILKSRMLSIISICLKSALLSINILTHMSKDSIANFGVFDIEYISTSSLIVGMVSVLNMNAEGFETLKLAMTLLDDIKKFGSPYASKNYAKLVKFLTATKTFVENASYDISPVIETYSLPENASEVHPLDDSELWETIYNDTTLDMNSNWEDFISSL